MNEFLLACLMVMVITAAVCITFGLVVVTIGITVAAIKGFWSDIVR